MHDSGNSRFSPPCFIPLCLQCAGLWGVLQCQVKFARLFVSCRTLIIVSCWQGGDMMDLILTYMDERTLTRKKRFFVAEVMNDSCCLSVCIRSTNNSPWRKPTTGCYTLRVPLHIRQASRLGTPCTCCFTLCQSVSILSRIWLSLIYYYLIDYVRMRNWLIPQTFFFRLTFLTFETPTHSLVVFFSSDLRSMCAHLRYASLIFPAFKAASARIFK